MSVSVRLRIHSARLPRRADGARSPCLDFGQFAILDLAVDHHTGYAEFGGKVIHSFRADDGGAP